MEISEFDIGLQEVTSITASLNSEYESYCQTLNQINEYQNKRLRPFGLECGDADPGLEALLQRASNAVGHIKNFIIKLYYAIKNLLDKVLHIFDTTLKKLKGYQEKFKTGLPNEGESEFGATKLKLYRNKVMRQRLEVLTREVSMNWTNTNGSIDIEKRKSLYEIGYRITTDGQGHVKYSYTGVYPKLDTIAGHGYTYGEVSACLNMIIGIYEKFPLYKENLTRMMSDDIKKRYQDAPTAVQSKAVILTDRASYIMSQKLISAVLREMREIGTEVIQLCSSIK